MSELCNSNAELKNAEKQYADELDSVKVDLTAAQQLAEQNQIELVQQKSLNIAKERQIQLLTTSFDSLRLAFGEQEERIAMLEAQNEIYRKDFEIEKQSREAAVKEKQQMLQDLRSLQKRNQELIEDQQKLADNYHKRISAVAAAPTANVASAADHSYVNNPQRPIRVSSHISVNDS